MEVFDNFLEMTKQYVEQNDGTLGIILNAENEDTFRWLVQYFSKRIEHTKDGLQRKNGVLLTGEVGSFKTTFMRIMQKMMIRKYQFAMVTTSQIVSEYNRTDKDENNKPYGGEAALLKYKQPKEYCFDELGEESEGKYYGSTLNVMKEIILIRYKLWQEQGIRTHFTSNTSLKKLQKMYGKRAGDRLPQMVNVAVLPKGTGFRSMSKPLFPTESIIEDGYNEFKSVELTDERRAEILEETRLRLEKITMRTQTYRHSGQK